MKVFYSIKNFLFLSGFLLAACTVSKPVAQGEYDDLYYNSEDRLTDAQRLKEARAQNKAQKNEASNDVYPDQYTNPDYYAEEKVQGESTQEIAPEDYASTINPNFNRYDRRAYGYGANRFNDPYYNDWQYRQNRMNYGWNDPFDPFWNMNAYYGNSWAFGFYNDPFFAGYDPYFNSYGYDPFYGYSYNPWFRNAYNRGFYNGYYWYTRSHGDYIIEQNNNTAGRKISRGSGFSRGASTTPRVRTDQTTRTESDNQNRSRRSRSNRINSGSNNQSNPNDATYQRRTRSSSRQDSGSNYRRRSNSGSSSDRSNSSGSYRRRSSNSSSGSSNRSSRRRGGD